MRRRSPRFVGPAPKAWGFAGSPPIFASPAPAMVQPETDYAHDRASPISRTNQAFRKGARPSVSSRILKRRILPDVRLRAVIRLRPVPVSTNRARLSSQRIRSAWIAFCRSTMVIGSWTCGGAISPYTSTFFKASISWVSGFSAMAPIHHK